MTVSVVSGSIRQYRAVSSSVKQLFEPLYISDFTQKNISIFSNKYCIILFLTTTYFEILPIIPNTVDTACYFQDCHLLLVLLILPYSDSLSM